MKIALGISEVVWQQLNMPQMQTDDLDLHTPLYVDCYLALEALHLRYPDYIAQTSRTERLLYQLFFALKGAKDARAMERSQQEAEAERVAREAVTPPNVRQ